MLQNRRGVVTSHISREDGTRPHGFLFYFFHFLSLRLSRRRRRRHGYDAILHTAAATPYSKRAPRANDRYDKFVFYYYYFHRFCFAANVCSRIHYLCARIHLSVCMVNFLRLARPSPHHFFSISLSLVHSSRIFPGSGATPTTDTGV